MKTKPKRYVRNTIFDNLMFKSDQQAQTTLELLDRANISWQRYTKPIKKGKRK